MTSLATRLAATVRHDVQSMHAYAVQPSAGFVKLDAMENPFTLPVHLQRELGERLGRVAINRYPGASGAALAQAGFTTTRFAASLVRPNLDDIPDYSLPAGVEMRPVEPHHLHQIWATHHEAFRGQPDFVETDESEFESFLADPLRDETLWKIAWAGDGPDAQVVGQVKSYINAAENRLAGRLRGYTEHISTTLGWRGKGIARALIVASLHELKARGMTEAALGADTDNPQAFDLYRMLGFEVIAYQAQYDKPRGQASIVS